jgi:hypothetical protein
MTETTAHIAGRKLDTSAGVPDDLARRMFDNLGSEYVGIVYLKSHTRAEDDDDKHRVTLAITNLEVAADPELAESLREIARSLYRGRVPTQLDLDSTLDDVEPGTDEYIARAKRLVQCETCLHAKADVRIKHEPDPDRDGAFCVWEATGTEVGVYEERPPALEESDDPEAEPAADDAMALS